MEKLRIEADETAAKNEELAAKVKALEQENLAKEQEITSLTHRNQLLDDKHEKIGSELTTLKKGADSIDTLREENENLKRRLEILEDEAEKADKDVREANEK
jgi:tropomyosin, fungi type